MLVKCMTEGCENYGILVERNMTDEGEYAPGIKAICEKCGNERVYFQEDNIIKPHFNIDAIALGTKRLFDKPKH